jgi:hypothetical protein
MSSYYSAANAGEKSAVTVACYINVRLDQIQLALFLD